MIPGSALALGSIPPESLVVVSAVAALACLLLWIDADVTTSRASSFVLVALALLLGMTVLQTLPLPAGIARVLSPATADIWDRALSPLPEPGPAWHPLTVATSASRIEVLRGFFYGCVFLGALRVATLERGGRFLVRVIVLSTVLMALSALAHAALSADRVFGVYRPHEVDAYFVGRLAPLLNTNHLSAYLNFGACVALGAMLSGRSMPRALSASAALVLAATSVWHGSRGATATLLFGVVLTFALTFHVKRRSRRAGANYGVLAACALAAAVIVSLSVSDRTAHLLSGDLVKVGVAKSSLSLITSSPWFGVGRGGFESVFSSVRQGITYVTFTNPEDIIVQWFVEWGVPVSIAAAAVLAWALRPQVLLAAVRPEVGAWVATVVIVLHDLVDYHLEVPGVVALVAASVAIVVGGRAKSNDRERRSVSSSARVAAFVLSSGTVAAIAAVWPALGHTLAEERRTLSALAIDKTLSSEEFRGIIRASMLRYPAEPFVPLMGAVRAQAHSEGGVVPWVARALERSPRFGRAHFVLARSLGAPHAAQARLEYRLAYEYDAGLRGAVLAEATSLVVDASSALELVPDGAVATELIEGLVASIASRLPSTAVTLDQEIERRSPDALSPLRRRATAAVSDATAPAPWCVGQACVRAAEAIADELAKREPDACGSHLIVVQLAIARGETIAGLDRFERELSHVTYRPACERELIQLALRNGQPLRADTALDRLVRGGCGAATECIGLYGWAASIEESRGHYVGAVRLYRRQLEIAPDDNVLQRIGELGSHDGVRADALEAYGTLATRHPSDSRWPARIAELRTPAGRPPGAGP